MVEASAGGKTGLGYTYGHSSAAAVVRDKLGDVVRGRSAMSPELCYWELVRAVRNMGREGIASTAISAIDLALWDLKGKLLDLPVVTLLGQVQDEVQIYGSGGFTSYSIPELQAQLAG